MKRMALLTALLCSLAPAAAAQFTQFDWTLDNPDGLDASFSASTIGFAGGLGGYPSGSYVQDSTVSPVDALVSFHVKTWPIDGECGSSNGYFGEEGQFADVTDCWFDGQLVFVVHAGAKMVFGFHVTNGAFPGTVAYTSFGYRPIWMPLGGALTGSAGTPELSGHGILQVGEPFGIQLSSAAPAAATALVLGFGQSNLPFKGGLLVPTPTLIVTGLATDAQGEFALDAIWTGPPPGSVFVVQAWIADAGGPKGYAASNALLVSAL